MRTAWALACLAVVALAASRPHPKAGWGSMVHSTQENLARTGIHPAEGGPRILSDEPTWQDFTRVRP